MPIWFGTAAAATSIGRKISSLINDQVAVDCEGAHSANALIASEPEKLKSRWSAD